VLLLLLHHIAGDGWSLQPLSRDLAALYRARCTGEAAGLAALPVQYADYTLWQQAVLGAEDDDASVMARQLSYWTAALAELPEQIELPADRPRPAVASHRGGRVALVIDADLHRGLVALARGAGASLFMVLQAGLAGLLSRLGAGSDIAIGSPIAGRSDAALDDLIGFFVNTLVLRTDTAGNPGFKALLGRVRAGNLAAYGHADLPFERLVEVLNPARSLSRHPLFQVMLAFETGAVGGARLELPGLVASAEPVSTAGAKFDLSLGLIEQRGADGAPAGIDGVLEYASDLFDAASVAALGGRLIRLLAAAVADPARALGALPILEPAERDTILRRWNDTGHVLTHAPALAAAADGGGDGAPIPAPVPATLPALFAAQAARTPDAAAVLFEDRVLSYAELDAHANRLAHHLQSRGVGPETIVGLLVERSPEMVVGLLGILKAGGAYLPLDPNYPRERLAFMLADAGAPVLVTQAALLERLPEAAAAQLVRLDADWPAIARQPGTAPPLDIDPDHPAYVIYTSGSTGTPKGVVVTHGGIPICESARLIASQLQPAIVFCSLHRQALCAVSRSQHRIDGGARSICRSRARWRCPCESYH
jgi:non-ribosomal peptide synthetase component F